MIENLGSAYLQIGQELLQEMERTYAPQEEEHL